MISYKEIRGVLKMLGINPYELYAQDRNSYVGWFPDLPERKSTFDVVRISDIILGKES